MSGSFESRQWTACVHRLDRSLYSHPKEFLVNGVRTPDAQRRIEPITLHHAGQLAQHITD